MIPTERPDNPDHAHPGARVEKTPLRLPESKACLIEFLVVDLRQTLARAEEAAALLDSPGDRPSAGRVLAEVGEANAKTARFFEFDQMAVLCDALARLGAQVGRLVDDDLVQALPRLAAILELLREQADGLAWGTVIRRPIAGLCESVHTLLDTGRLNPDRALPPGATANDAMIADGVLAAEPARPVQVVPNLALPASGASQAAPALEAAPVQPPEPIAEPAPAHQRPSPMLDEPLADAAPEMPITHPLVFAFESDPARTLLHLADPAAAHTPITAPLLSTTHAEPIAPMHARDPIALDPDAVPVSADRLNTLLGLVGDLVMQKDRLAQLAGSPQSVSGEHLATVTGSVARVAADLRDAVLDSRQVALEHLFARLRMAVAERAAAQHKRVTVDSEGDALRIDCSLASRLADPLAALVHAIVDFGVELPRERAAAGKPEHATITLRAAADDRTLTIELSDDGRGLSRRRVGRKALRLGIIDEPTLDALTDESLFAVVFTPEYNEHAAHGLHTLRADIAALGGDITLSAVENAGATMTIRTPLEALTTPALLVEVGARTFALPACDIDEVLRPAAADVQASANGPVLRRGDRLIPYIEASALLGVSAPASAEPPTVVVLSHAQQSFALRVSRALGTRDMVIRDLDPALIGPGPVRGGTIAPDGSVTLVIDTARTLALAHTLAHPSRTAARTAA